MINVKRQASEKLNNVYSIQFHAGTPKTSSMTSKQKTGSADRAVRSLAGLTLILTPLVSSRELWSSSQMQFAAYLVGAMLIVSALRFPDLVNRNNRR